jgi:hypothetical protein
MGSAQEIVIIIVPLTVSSHNVSVSRETVTVVTFFSFSGVRVKNSKSGIRLPNFITNPGKSCQNSELYIHSSFIHDMT